MKRSWAYIIWKGDVTKYVWWKNARAWGMDDEFDPSMLMEPSRAEILMKEFFNKGDERYQMKKVILKAN